MAQLIKYGAMTNVATYKYVCNDIEDLLAINKKDYNFGSEALVIHNADGKVHYFIADLDKQWIHMKTEE